MLILIVKAVGGLLVIFAVISILYNLLPKNQQEPNIVEKLQEVLEYLDNKQKEEDRFNALLENLYKRLRGNDDQK